MSVAFAVAFAGNQEVKFLIKTWKRTWFALGNAGGTHGNHVAGIDLWGVLIFYRIQQGAPQKSKCWPSNAVEQLYAPEDGNRLAGFVHLAPHGPARWSFWLKESGGR